jgi:hypothetical protein
MKFKESIKKYWKVICALVVIFLASYFYICHFHLWQTSEDRQIENKIYLSFEKKGSLRLSELFPDADKVCVLTPYSGPEDIKDFLSEDAFDYLEKRINTSIGMNGTYWWLIELKDKQLISLYKIRTRLEPISNYYDCLSPNAMVFKYMKTLRSQRNYKYLITFSIKEIK